MPMLARMQQLVVLDLGRCTQITDACVIGLCAKVGGTLRQLNLESCPRLTDASLKVLCVGGGGSMSFLSLLCGLRVG